MPTFEDATGSQRSHSFQIDLVSFQSHVPSIRSGAFEKDAALDKVFSLTTPNRGTTRSSIAPAVSGAIRESYQDEDVECPRMTKRETAKTVYESSDATTSRYSSFFFKHAPKTITDEISSPAMSSIAWWVCAFGGFGRFQSMHAQRAYDVAYAFSFILCSIMCLSNFAFQYPPWYDGWMDAAMIQGTHILALHGWLVWRRVNGNSRLVKLSQRWVGYAGAETCSEKQRRRSVQFISHLRIGAAICLILQFLVTVLATCVLVLPGVDTVFFERVNSYEIWSKWTIALHAIFMIFGVLVIAPSLVVSYLFFFLLICRLHIMDILNSIDIDDEDLGRDTAGTHHVISIACDLMDAAQERLDHTCRLVASFMCHIVLADVFAIGVVTYHVRLHATRQLTWNRGLVYRILYDITGAGIGAVGFFSCLITPALVSSYFLDAPLILTQKMRHRGVPADRFSRWLPYLMLRLRGFSVYQVPLNAAHAAKAITVVSVMSTILYIQTQAVT